MTTIRGIFRPAGTSYHVYEGTFPNGDTHAEGAFSEEEFRRVFRISYGIDPVSVRVMDETDVGDGWKEVQ